MNGVALPPIYGISLFSGIGGLELGIQKILPNFRTICYVEGEIYAAKILHKNMQKGLLHLGPIYSDVVTFPSVANHFSQKVDFITSGFPCQPFSNAGNREGTNDERWLWDSILETIREVQPSFLFLENVSNLLNEWEAFDEISKSLAEIGFNIEWANVRASDVGANHQRNRIFIFAYIPGKLSQLTITNPYGQRPIKTNNGRASPIISSRKKEINRRKNVSNPNHYGKPIMPIRNEKGRFIQQPKSNFTPSWWRRHPPFSPIYRVDDGISNGMDRLRALGNSVVPFQASCAFYELIERAINRPSKS